MLRDRQRTKAAPRRAGHKKPFDPGGRRRTRASTVEGGERADTRRPRRPAPGLSAVPRRIALPPRNPIAPADTAASTRHRGALLAAPAKPSSLGLHDDKKPPDRARRATTRALARAKRLCTPKCTSIIINNRRGGNATPPQGESYYIEQLCPRQPSPPGGRPQKGWSPVEFPTQ